MTNPDNRSQFFVTADAVVIRNGMVLLIKRRPNSRAFPNYWAFPGGHVDHGESTEQAVLRELQEETGVEGRIVDLVGVFSKPGRDPRGPYVTAAYLVEALTLDHQAGDDAVECAWWDLNKAQAMQLAFDHNDVLDKAMNIIHFREYLEMKGLID